MSDHKKPIHYGVPDITSLHKAGFQSVDMHVHTNHSDGFFTTRSLVKFASKRNIGVAVTDHNQISGSLQVLSEKSDVLIIPGIELETMEGPHLLFYFYTSGDMEDFFKVFLRERNKTTPGLLRNLPVLECLNLAEPFDCIRIAAHPFGYFGINRGVLKCVEKQMLPGVLETIDGIEVICGGMMKNLNERAILYAKEHPVPFTGGSDAHILADVGNVVTAVRSERVEDFLNGIKKRQNRVIGKSGGYIHKGATAGVIAWSFVPYSVSKLGAHYCVQKKKTSRLVRSYRNYIRFIRKNEELKDKSEEGREES
ncbi:MAG: PHP domain-containing protein [Methanomicrobiales archaeon]|nr:PHP domain-containing protein [Methanomicrobiales archaeon]